jgi:capsular polysaccharide transport system ATP-binding protein
MITVNDVHKRYWKRNGDPHWVLRGVSITFPADRNVGVIGVNGAGKSTLLRLIAGTDMPTRGEIRVESRVSWPIGLTRGLQQNLTGRQNARFICRIHGFQEELVDRIQFVHSFSELGDSFDEPVRNYSSGMRGRLNFALSLAFEFDTYLVDEVMAAGDARFKAKAQKAMKGLAARASMIVVSHSDDIIKGFCDSGVWLHEGKAYWFDSVMDALKQYKRANRLARLAKQGLPV